jgi:quinol monooxygenase YgiN
MGEETMRIAIIELKALGGKESAVADFLQAHAARSKELEDGCLDFQIATDPESAETYFIIMNYETAEAQAGHRETEHFKRFVDECMPMLQDAPDGTKFFGRRLLDTIG